MATAITDRLAGRGLDVITPAPADRAFVHQVIFNGRTRRRASNQTVWALVSVRAREHALDGGHQCGAAGGDRGVHGLVCGSGGDFGLACPGHGDLVDQGEDVDAVESGGRRAAGRPPL
ncbi:hypothetical protein [Streptomyces yatensis]|uniref:hypothetical protein n=1 Tax=Streptomyces yatensis TaxID=155177 RepID=UPI001B3C56D5|nr:hypothetical protein [Streptomyces yatensis]